VNFTPVFFKGYPKITDQPRASISFIDQLCEGIKRYPEQALCDPVILKLIRFIRESECKGRLPRGSFDKILKAMKIDYRRRPIPGADLKNIARRDLFFLLKIYHRGKGTSVDSAIEEYFRANPEDENFKPEDNYKRIYKAYKKVFDELTSKLSPKEAIDFVEHAGQGINVVGLSRSRRVGRGSDAPTRATRLR